ncbi:hypothetical protein HAX54_015097 [Datura stramonium]|uniref:MAPK kinase substrate protein n=1 Tax=Datura stramonium TaxID=4076 RepID=A0ABS8TR71_DATST|nr:hypothetical protein [Datura stramonium]
MVDQPPTLGEMLPRSEISFRRQGSSGLVWDDKLLSGELKKISTQDHQDEEKKLEKKKEKKSSSSSEPRPIKSRATDNYMQPSIDPPSPKVSGCGVCGIFGKPVKSQKPRKNVKRKS